MTLMITTLMTVAAHGATTSNRLQRRSTRAKGSLVGLFSSDDYPNDALGKGETGTVSVLLTIGADGRVSDCRLRLSSLSPSLDAATCRILAERARFEPARDRAGHPVTDKYSQRITWKIPSPDPQPVGGVNEQMMLVEHADGRFDCMSSPEDLTSSIPGFCAMWRKQVQGRLAQLPSPMTAPYRATFTLRTLLGEGIPTVTTSETTIRGAARLQINEMGRVTGCQPIFEASLNGDDATDLCNHADEQRYVALPSALKDRGDRRMIVIRTLSFEVGEPPNKVPVG